MSDIPEDILKTAEALFSRFAYLADGPSEDEVARLILAERQRWNPAVTYFERYCVDEADDDDFPERFRQQHEDAKAFKAIVR